ncbi:MAG: rod shape-determining protein MreC [Solirubrobacteraceae bacterium]|nr:rod shape-determining protein MreC [Patulibacter sp.]
MPDEKTFRRRRAVFLLLVVAAFVLLTGSYVGAFGGTETGVAGIVSPIQEGASKVAKPGRDLVNWVGDTFRAKGDLKKVTKERNDLQVANAKLVNLLSESGQQDALNKIAAESGYESYGPVTAHLSVQSPSAWYRTIIIDKGSSDGISLKDPVVAPNGLAGVVSRVLGGSSEVRLITDPKSGVTARVGVSTKAFVGEYGPLVPSSVGTVGDLILQIPRSSALAKGQPVITAGSSSSTGESHFPPGIPIGTIAKIDGQNTDTQTVHVTASADLRHLDVLTVLTAVKEPTP